MSDVEGLANLRVLVLAERETFADFDRVYAIDDGGVADDVLARFVRSTRGDATTALERLRVDYEWRAAEDAAALRSTAPADVLGCDPAVLAEYYGRRCCGLDARRRLCFYQSYRHTVVKKLKTVVPLESVVRYHWWEMERATAILDHLKARGGGDTMAIILDVQGMTISKHINSDFLYLVKAIAQHDQHHYPERMGVTYIINAPSVFGLVWRTVRPWLDPITVAKIKIVTARSDWRAAVGADLGDAVVERLDADADLDDDHDLPPRDVAISLLELDGAAAPAGNADRRAGASPEAAPPADRRDPAGSLLGSERALRGAAAPLLEDPYTKAESGELDPSDANPLEDEFDAEHAEPKMDGRVGRYEALALVQLAASLLVAAITATALLDGSTFAGAALLVSVLVVPLTLLGLRAIERLDVFAFRLYVALQIAFTLALCVLSVVSITVAANGHMKAKIRAHRAFVGGACLLQLCSAAATSYGAAGVVGFLATVA